MSEKPILFSDAMVRAILAGTKTQTRRVLKPQPPPECDELVVGPYHPTVIVRDEEEPGPETFGVFTADGEWGRRCPYGGPGDRLWVREAWLRFECPGHQDRHLRCDCEDTELVRYAADQSEMMVAAGRWRPSIHMPRWACRLELELTDVRVERLQDISEEDARAEGVEWLEEEWPCYRGGFRILWDSINLERGFGWDSNPWVWALTFKRGVAKERAA